MQEEKDGALIQSSTSGYQRRQEARRERLLERAEQARNVGQATFEQARGQGRLYPPGQPILVGHHSERRHRNYLASMDRLDRKGVEALKKSQELESRAAAVGTGGIACDDPEAIDKLRSQLEELELLQTLMKTANAAIRKGKTPEDKIESLIKLGMQEAEGQQLIVPRFGKDGGYPSYKLTNNGANIRRIKVRLQELEKLQATPLEEFECADYSYVESADEGRVMFTFPCKPSEDIRGVLKGNGFKWSPDREAWVRILNGSALSAGRHLRSVLELLIICAR